MIEDPVLSDHKGMQISFNALMVVATANLLKDSRDTIIPLQRCMEEYVDKNARSFVDLDKLFRFIR